jgi:hypothetical protein
MNEKADTENVSTCSSDLLFPECRCFQRDDAHITRQPRAGSQGTLDESGRPVALQ